MIKNLVIAIALMLSLAGGLFAVSPPKASADFCSGQAQTTYQSGGLEYGRALVTGCAGHTVQVCVQYSGNSATYGCATYNVTSNSQSGLWSFGVSAGTCRTWLWISGVGTLVGWYG